MGWDMVAPLEKALEEIERRWGAGALRRARELPEVAGIMCGWAEVDRLTGGLVRGAVNALSGQPTSGKTTLAYRWLGHAQASGERVLYLDTTGTFDAAYALTCGLNVAELVVVSVESAAEALWLLRDVGRSSCVDVVALDAPTLKLPSVKGVLQATTLLIMSERSVAQAVMQLECACMRFEQTMEGMRCELRLRLTRHPQRPAAEARVALLLGGGE